jgi:hypothetical protein
MGDIGTRPGDEVIDAKHVPTLLDKEVAEVGTQESCSASDHDEQCISLSMLLACEWLLSMETPDRRSD